MDTKVSIALLAGGFSKRFGKNKLCAPWNGKTIIERVVDLWNNSTNDLFLQTNPIIEKDLKIHIQVESKFWSQTRIVHDSYEEQGPLGGLMGALENARHSWVLVIAGDMPKSDPRVLNLLLKQAKDGFDFVVPKWSNGWLEPLCALYNKTILPHLRKAVEESKGQGQKPGLFAIIRKMEACGAFLPIDDLIKLGALSEEAFYNINTQSDYNSFID